jgi:DnaJ-class molecular chaperone
MIHKEETTGPVKFSTKYPCPNCAGEGESIVNLCDACEGQGFIVEPKNLQFSVKVKK